MKAGEIDLSHWIIAQSDLRFSVRLTEAGILNRYHQWLAEQVELAKLEEKIDESI